ncbi:type VII secretion system-associated protein [Amycolatopsis benzoatilytica]|uniref:type VII secretion system-associated protein n=1 Tax=Amycolatopsis benzoatilytica TaxID=346045 RepID=UPI0003614DF1|nr:type VII secretion system-associated protein [Amycolatopsis benzoatilytica]
MPDRQWILLVDPAWRPASTEDGAEVPSPPPEAVVGGWLAGEDGSVSRFEPNPGYAPAAEDSPADPLDAVLRLTARGAAGFDQLAAAFRESPFAVALDRAETPIVAPSPDDIPCLLVTTAPAHRRRVRADGWLPATPADLLQLMDRYPDTDLLLNPGTPGCLRLAADSVREMAAEPGPSSGRH